MKTGELNILGDAFTVGWTDYSDVSTITGWSTVSSKNIYYKIVGKFIFIAFRIIGTSNANTASFTVPVTFAAGFNVQAVIIAQDGGSTWVTAGGLRVNIEDGGNTVRAGIENSSTAWTDSGTKTIYGQIFAPFA
jgi:hypothetical protein